MSNPRKVDIATEADWRFTECADAMKAIGRAAERAAYEFEALEFDDALQDAQLWLAVRPEMVAKARESGDYRQLGQDIYTNALRKPAISAAGRSKAFVSKEAIEEQRGYEL